MAERKLVAERHISVNGYDIDAMGIVSNIVYVRWFEDLRTDFIDQYMSYPEMMKQDLSPILMHTDIDYKLPITIYDQPVGRCYLSRVSKLRWEFEFEIMSGDQVHCIGRQFGTFFDLKKQKVAKVPSVFRSVLDKA